MTEQQKQDRLSILQGQLENLIEQHARVCARYGMDNRRERQAWLGVENITRQIRKLKGE